MTAGEALRVRASLLALSAKELPIKGAYAIQRSLVRIDVATAAIRATADDLQKKIMALPEDQRLAAVEKSNRDLVELEREDLGAVDLFAVPDGILDSITIRPADLGELIKAGVIKEPAAEGGPA